MRYLAQHKIISWNAIARLLSVLFNFLVVLAVSRSLGPVAKGETTLWVTAIFIGVFASNIAGGWALVNYLKHNEKQSVLVPTYVWSLFANSLVALVMWATLAHSSQFIIHIFFLASISSFSSVHQTILLSKHRFKAFNFLTFWQPMVLWLVLAALLYLGKHKTLDSFWIALYISTLSALAVSFFLVYKTEKLAWGFSFTTLRAILANGFPFQLAELLQLLHLRLYFFLLANFNESGLYHLGIYSVGISILESVWIFPRSVATINFAATVKQPSAHNTLRWLRIALLLALVLLFSIFLIPIEVYAYVFGEGFLYVKYSVKYLFPGIGLYVFVLVIGSHFMGKGNYGLMSALHLVGIAISLLLCYVWIPDYEMSGAGLAATVSFAVSAAVLLFYFLKTEHYSLKDLWLHTEDFNF